MKFHRTGETGEGKLWIISSLLPLLMEMVGTVAFAASGAMVAADRAMDIFGVIVLGVTTAVGGGAIRDVILGIATTRQCSRIQSIHW